MITLLTIALTGVFCYKPLPNQSSTDMVFDFTSNPPITWYRNGDKSEQPPLKQLADGVYDDSEGILIMRNDNLILQTYERADIREAFPVNTISECFK